MHSSALLAACLAAAASASPLAASRRQAVEPLTHTNSSLPNVAIFATGGTIAGSSSSATDTTNYSAGAVGVQALIDAVPQLANVSNVSGEQIANTGSENVNSTILLKLSHSANTLLCADNSTTDGLVITHGTDTLEETAFFLDLTVNCHKPVVVVGAMRPSTAISADGPANLLEAVTLAASSSAQDRGAMVVLNDRIGSAFYTQKTNGNTLDTFKAVEQGYLGGFLSTKPFFYYPPARPTFKRDFDLSNITDLPKVDVLYGSQDFDGKLVAASVANGAKGVIVAGTGAGSLSTSAEPYVEAALEAGVPVVLAAKPANGASPPGDTSYIKSGYINPVKSRLQLQLALATGLTFDEIRSLFEGDLRESMGL